jgi:hypothetical protein
MQYNLFLHILPFIYQWLKFVTPKRIVYARFLVHYLHFDMAKCEEKDYTAYAFDSKMICKAK